MAITLKGFAQAFITNINLIAKQNDPQLKLTPTGFLKMLLQNNAVTEINNIEDLRKGQKREIKIRYMQRGLESDVTDVDNCEANLSPDWKESTITNPLFSKIGLFISDDDMRRYEEEATATLAVGEGQTAPLMRGLYELLLTKLIGLIGKIDSNLVAAQASKWGNNAAYNPKTGAQTLAMGESASMDDGYVKLLEDAVINEVNDTLLVCGNGLINRYDTFNRLKSGVDAQGFGALPVNAYYDPRTINAWGKDHFGAFAKGTIGFVDWNQYVGSYAGQKGNSVFFTIPVPVDIDGELTSLVFDAQLRYIDCPTYGEDGQVIQPRGWQLFVSKHYGLFNLPTDAFASTDVLNGVNGSFHYVATKAQNVQAITPTADAVFNTKEVTDPEPQAEPEPGAE